MDEIEIMFQRREQQKAAAAHERKQRETARKNWWRTLRMAVAEMVCWTLVITLLCVYSGINWIAPALAVPAALIALMAGTWRACQYWQLLSK